MNVSSTPAASGAGAATSGTAASSSTTAPVTENMFLQLLVAQLQNQDPTDPADSTTFVTQLAQFQTMEQSMNQGTNISGMLSDLNQMVTAQGGTPATPAASST
jgi:flagellar basal-body rod modification protein FlgD